MDVKNPKVVALDPRDPGKLSSTTNVAGCPESLEGLVVGLLSNNKPNSELLLRNVAEMLKQRHGVSEVIESNKGTHRVPAPETILTSLVSSCDVVVTATAE